MFRVQKWTLKCLIWIFAPKSSFQKCLNFRALNKYYSKGISLSPFRLPLITWPNPTIRICLRSDYMISKAILEGLMKSEKNVAEGAVVSKSALYKSLHNFLALRDIGCHCQVIMELDKSLSLQTWNLKCIQRSWKRWGEPQSAPSFLGFGGLWFDELFWFTAKENIALQRGFD